MSKPLPHRPLVLRRVPVFLLAALVVAAMIWLNLLNGVDDHETWILLATAAVVYVGLCTAMLDAWDEHAPPRHGEPPGDPFRRAGS